MATKTQALPQTVIETELALRHWLTSIPTDRLMTRTQYMAIVKRLAPLLPATLSLSYRTPKGYLYITVQAHGIPAHILTLNNRAKWR